VCVHPVKQPLLRRNVDGRKILEDEAIKIFDEMKQGGTEE
jgi:hypothetical protein